MSEALIIAVVSAIFSLAGSVPITWFLTLRYQRGKIKSEAKGLELDNAKKISDAEGSELDNAKKVVDIFNALSERQTREIDQLRIELENIKNKLLQIKQNACYTTECPNRKQQP